MRETQIIFHTNVFVLIKFTQARHIQQNVPNNEDMDQGE
jgi:hypothetical protein